MEKQKLEITITGIAVVIFLVLLTSTLAKRPKKTVTEPANNIPNIEIARPDIAKTPKPTKLEWGRDPFILNPERPTQREGVFILTAVMWDEKNPYAIINGEVSYIGKEINGYTVTNINKDSAVLKKDSEELIIQLYN